MNIQVGTIVEVEWDDGKRGVYRIGFEGESNLADCVIAVDAPLPRALCGASEGDSRTYRAGHVERTVRVIRVRGEDDAV